jgi:hypothetical protein
MRKIIALLVMLFGFSASAALIACDTTIYPIQPTSVSFSTSTTVQNQTIIVYSTKTGSKYHRSGCRYLAHSCIPLTLQEAKRQGLSACSVCNPP